MNYSLVSALTLSSFVLSAPLMASHNQDGNIKTQVDAISAQVDTNTAAISNNTNAINENIDAINANSAALAKLSGAAVYDYRDYSPALNITGSVLRISGGGLAASDCVTEKRLVSRSNVNGVNVSTLDRVRTTSTGQNCGFHRFVFENRDDAQYMMVNDARSGDGASTVVLREIEDGMLMRSSNMEVGKSYGNASPVTITRSSGVTRTAVVQNVTFQGVEDVTVPYNGGTTYNGCMRVHWDRNTTDGLGGPDFNVVSWYCKDVGLVKRIDASGNIWHLTDLITTP